MKHTKYCTFFVEGLYFGVDVRHVQEVLRAQPMTHVPLAHDVVRGLINLRGQILTAVDMRERLGLGGQEPEETINVVVTNHKDEAFILVVYHVAGNNIKPLVIRNTNIVKVDFVKLAVSRSLLDRYHRNAWRLHV